MIILSVQLVAMIILSVSLGVSRRGGMPLLPAQLESCLRGAGLCGTVLGRVGMCWYLLRRLV